MPGNLRTDGDTRHVQPISLRDGVVNWLTKCYVTCSSPIFWGPLLLRCRDTLVLVFLKFAFWLFLEFASAPGRRAAEGRWQWPTLDCHSIYGTACAFGLTWRPFTGSLFLSPFWCRLKPGPSGERGRKSGLLQDMLVTGFGPTSEPVDGRVQAWTRHGSDQLSASEHSQDVHRNVCETIGHF